MNMKKKLRGLLSLWLVVLMMVTLLPMNAMAASLAYHDNGADSGSAPAPISSGDSNDITDAVIAGAGSLQKEGYVFTGWLYGSRIYQPGETITVSGSGHADLYAQWKELPTYTVTYTDGVGGEAFPDQVHYAYEGAPTPGFSGYPTRAGFTFLDWAPSVAETVTGNAVYKAIWEAVPVYSTGRRITQTYSVSISGDKASTVETATLNGKTATIDKVDLAKLDTVIGKDVKTGLVKFDFSIMKKELDAVKIPTDALKKIAEAAMDPENDTEGVEILFAEGMSITLDAEALAAIAEQAEGKDITFTFKTAKTADLNSQQQKTVVGQTAYEISISSNNKQISDIGGEITIQVPYELGNNEQADVYYVDENGNQEPYEASYDSEKETVSWTTDHLSIYMIDSHDPSIVTYTVQKGDTLQKIAQAHGCTVAEIMELNRDLLGYNSVLIYEGWELRIPSALR